MKQWKCNICGYIHEGENPPPNCPICNAPDSQFSLISTQSIDEVQSKQNSQDVFTDILVIGSGAAALSAATTAKHEGNDVIVLEKADTFGGTTRRSGGRYWILDNYKQGTSDLKDSKEDAIAYMAKSSFPTIFNSNLVNYGLNDYDFEMLNNYYDEGKHMLSYFRDIGVFDSEIDTDWNGKPHVDYLENLEQNKGILGRSLYATRKDTPIGSGGDDLVSFFIDWLEKNEVKLLNNHKVVDLIYSSNEVKGVIVEHSDNSRQNFYAKKGVIFGTGGFSHNKDLLSRFHENPLIGGCAVPTNTGDFIPMAERLGAKLGNMSNAYRVQSMLELYLANPEGSSSTFYFVGDSFIEVNKYGKRVVNEKRNYNDRTRIHYTWDANKGEYPNEYLFFIFDNRAIDYWGGFPPFPTPDTKDSSYIIRGNSVSDLAQNINTRLKSLSKHIGSFKLSEDFSENLNATISRYNLNAINGKDLDFNRGETAYELDYATLPPHDRSIKWPSDGQANIALFPIETDSTLYAIILAPGSLDTNGGPMINKHAQILDYDNNPITGLYGAGNCVASSGKAAYWGAGATIGPAMTYGYLAAKHASATKK